jgi:peptidoglycan/LPS O-acetylase OafA/YrhL
MLIVGGFGATHETIGTPRMVLFGYTVLALLYAVGLIIGVTASANDVIGRSLRWPILGRVGMLAYAVYLFHLPLVGICCWLIASPALATVTALAATFVLADRSWKYFEGPMMKRGRAHEYEVIPEGAYRRGPRLEEVA